MHSAIKIKRIMKTNLEILDEVRIELTRFQEKLAKATKEALKYEESLSHSTEFAACKRAALDLKRELTKLTQSSKYKWGNE